MKQRPAKAHARGATWRTLEEVPRYMRVLGRVAVDERMLLCELELDGGKVWLEPFAGRVYVQGRWSCNAECVQLGDPLELPEQTPLGHGRPPA